MDIQKELESFKTVAIAKGLNVDGETTQTNYRFYCLTTRSGWEMWQAAKAQAVLEQVNEAPAICIRDQLRVASGHSVVVPKEPTLEMCHRGRNTRSFKVQDIYKAMIAVQENE